MTTSGDHLKPGRPSVRSYFDREAGRFPEVGSGSSSTAQRVLTGLFRRSIRLRFDRVFELAGTLKGCSVIDIGCGSGTYAVHAANLGAARVVGIDVSSEMIKLARQRAIKEQVPDQCEFIVGDFLTLPIAESFDFVVAMGVMDYVADPVTFFAGIANVTRQMAFLSFPKAGGFLAWQRQMRYRKRCPLFLYERSNIERLLDATFQGRWSIESVARDWFVTIRGTAT